MKHLLDFTTLPPKYNFNKESLTAGKYIDDCSYLMYRSMYFGTFSGKGASMAFLFNKPFEWTYLDFIAFLLKTCQDYDFKIENVETNFSAILDDYEVNIFDDSDQLIPELANRYCQENDLKSIDSTMFREEKRVYLSHPKRYDGAYKWIMEDADKSSEEYMLFNKFLDDKADANDIERALIFATRTLPYSAGKTDPLFMTKELFSHVIDWVTFSVVLPPDQKKKLETDLTGYLAAFMTNKLTRDTGQKRMHGTSVGQSINIYKFEKQKEIFKEHLQKMADDFGDTFVLENIFEEPFPNFEIESEEIRKRYAQRNFYFLHTLFALQVLGIMEVRSVYNNWDYREDNPLMYQANVKLLPAFFNETKGKVLSFDADKSRFYVQGKEIKLIKFKDEYHTLRVIFENPAEISREWFFSEIREKIDPYASPDKDKKYYNAIYQTRLKLEKQGIKDFFITTKQSVKIDPKYLS